MSVCLRPLLALTALCAALGSTAPRLLGQTRPLSVSVGAGWPNADQKLAVRWRDAWLARVTLTAGTPARRVRGRLVYEHSRWVARDAGTARAYGPTLTDHALLLETLLGPRVPPPLHPYLVLGVGQHRLRIPGHMNPYGGVPGVGAGLGVSIVAPWRAARGCALDAEVRRRAILTDYAVGEWNWHTSTPIALSLRC